MAGPARPCTLPGALARSFRWSFVSSFHPLCLFPATPQPPPGRPILQTGLTPSSLTAGVRPPPGNQPRTPEAPRKRSLVRCAAQLSETPALPLTWKPQLKSEETLVLESRPLKCSGEGDLGDHYSSSPQPCGMPSPRHRRAALRNRSGCVEPDTTWRTGACPAPVPFRPEVAKTA
jgi:hypothetical protein